MTTTVTYREALNRAMADALAEDDSVFLFGEDVGAAGGAFKLTEGLFDRFGPQRVRDTPISEQAIIGTAIGAALMGLRPVAEIMFADFAACLLRPDRQRAGQVPLHDRRPGDPAGHDPDGQRRRRRLRRAALAAGRELVSQRARTQDRSSRNAGRCYGLLRAAVRDPDPVLVFEHKHLFNVKGELADTPEVVELGRAEVVRSGSDVTLVATQLMRHRAEEAADRLAREGVKVELIDPRTLVPLDYDTIAASVDKTNRFVGAQECPNDGSWGASLVARLVRDRLEIFDAPPILVGADDTPVPYAGALEELWLPSVDRIVDGVKQTLAY